MRAKNETVALLHYATGTGKTVTAVLDARSVGDWTLFVAHIHELAEQAVTTFRKLWSNIAVGKYEGSVKQPFAHVVCGSIQSIAFNLDKLKDDSFGYLM